MKANEVMVGDYVYNHRNWECPIVEIHKNSAVVIARHYGEEEFLLSDLRPIPLTPEILEKNGFETEDDVHFSIQGQSAILELLLVEVPFDGYYFDIVRTEKTINKCNQRCYIDRYFASIDYVHQLQHALRLCGIEKEIIL